MSSPKLSILIVSYNGREHLESCLASIRAHLKEGEYEVCVIDNASNDGSVDWAKKNYPEYQLIANNQNFGFAKAVNQGLMETTAPYVMWLNPDTELLDGKVDELLALFEEKKDVGILGPKILDPDGTTQLSCRAFPSYKHYFFGRYSLFTKLFPKNPISRKYLSLDSGYDKSREIDWVSGACLVHRRELIHQVGLLDEGYFMYFEEVDFCRRAQKKGWKTYFHPVMHVQHAIAGSSQKSSFRTLVIRHQSNWRYYTKFFKRNKIKDALIVVGLCLRCGLMMLSSMINRLKRKK